MRNYHNRCNKMMVCRKTVSVWTHTPEMQSTTTRAPSVTRIAAVTSELKSKWPGESMRLTKKCLSGSLSCSINA
ncbi:hypothetical protein BpHYR1_009619 [Brachionus plicatilis]|uniref:Uncharacterized protein n=1 Tax=Brachionus plicatilis TaxID=10195 RepID=A0A3M7QER5_BRAPC|nr:hypothetical protein BpHYR1_009619 [Brachionus plicatilis]